MSKPKISIILPSISPEKWEDLYGQIKKSVGQFAFEVICVGPFFPPKQLETLVNFKFITDFGCVSRCLQIGASVAEGEYLTWLPDDSIVIEKALEDTVLLFQQKRKIDGITILYSEGSNFSGNQHLDPKYWTCGTHADLRLPSVNNSWQIAPIFMYQSDYFREIGGLDCSFEHVNMNTHDLAFRVQNAGGTIFPSPCRVLAVNWKPWGEPKGVIQRAYEENDLPAFRKLYGGEINPLLRNVELGNWRKTESIWSRRFLKK